MAKKKSNNTVSLAVSCAGVLFGALAFCLAGFLAAVKLGGADSSSTLTGFQAAFGYTETTGGIVSVSVEICKFNFMITLALFLPLLGGLLCALKGKLFGFIALVAFVAGAVLLFMCPALVKSTLVTSGLSDWLGSIVGGDASVPTALGVGAIIGGICAVLGALVAAYKTFLMK